MMKYHERFLGYYKNNPPMTLFSISVFLFTLVTFSMSVFVRQNPVKDPEAVSWNSVMKKFTSLELCVSREDKKQGILPYPTVDFMKISVGVPVTKGFVELAKNYSALEGVISSELLGLTVEEISHADIRVSFSFDSKPTESADTKDKYACITLTGPRNLLSTLPSHAQCMETSEGRATAFEGKTKKGELQCVDGISYELEFEEVPDWMVYLSEEERYRISMHLLVTTCFLLTTVIFLICVACVKGARTALPGEGYRLM